MKQFFACLVVISTGVSSVCASLGDNDDKIEDSYGKLIQRHLQDDGSVGVVYHKDRYLYFVTFVDRRSVLEGYSRFDGRELSANEISRFLKTNAGRKVNWTQHESTSKERTFERSDHKAKATYGKVNGRPTLTVRALGRTKAPSNDE